MEFYITLTSDACRDIYPGNRTSRFTTLLPRKYDLEGEWLVGLCEIQFPNSFIHLTQEESSIMFSFKDVDKKSQISNECRIPYGVYTDIESLIRGINKNTVLAKHFQFSYDKTTNFVMIKRSCKFESCRAEKHKLTFNQKLCQILGYDFVWSGIEFSDLSLKIGRYPASLARGLPANLFIHTDLVSSTVFGNIRTPLLRIVPFNPSQCPYGENYTAIFSPYYHLVQHNSFQTIEIDIRDQYMNLIPFNYGPLHVTLHFKRAD